MPEDTNSPVVVVTGASAGLGRSIARVFARKGWRIGLIARGEEGLAGAAEDVKRLGGEPLVLPADVADAAAVQAAGDMAVARWGVIDVWVNNAMATVVGTVDDIPPAEYRRVLEVTCLGQVHGTLAALRHMRRRDRGTIVQIGSALAYRSIPLQAPYCAAKAGARAFTDSLRSELSHEGSRIRLTAVHMPAMNTPQFEWARLHMDRKPRPVGTIFDPDAAAEHVYTAAIEAPRELWVGNTTVQAIVGQMLAPGLLDWRLGKMAWEGQLDGQPSPDRQDNLDEPVEVDKGADGPFEDQVRPGPRAYDPAMLRLFGLGASVALAASLALVARRR